MTLLRRISVLSLPAALAACFADAGPPGHSPTGGATTTTSATTGEETAVATTMVATTSATTTTATTADASSVGTTEPAACGQEGQRCGTGCCGCLTCSQDQVCVAVDVVCGPCEVCGATGACEPAPVNSQCVVPDADCQAKVWGKKDATCHRYAGLAGTCDEAGSCQPEECGGMGQAIASCADADCLLPAGCMKGAAADTITVELLCESDGPTPKCSEECKEEDGQSVLITSTCGPGGACMELEKQSCGGFACAGPSDCLMVCDPLDPDSCDRGLTCLMGLCM